MGGRRAHGASRVAQSAWMITLISFSPLFSCTLGDSVEFVAVGSRGSGPETVALSEDGTDWSYARNSLLTEGRGVCFSPLLGIWLVGGSSAGNFTMAVSTDALTWVGVLNSKSVFDVLMYDCDWGVDRFVAVGLSSQVVGGQCSRVSSLLTLPSSTTWLCRSTEASLGMAGARRSLARAPRFKA